MNNTNRNTAETRRLLASETGQAYLQLLRYLEYTLHELPMGVLYGANGADEAECRELMSDTYRLESLATELGIDLSDFIATCRWHYERYPHYLSRHRHFGNYAKYMEKHEAPSEHRGNPKWISDTTSPSETGND